MKSITLVTCVLIVLRVQEQTSVGRTKSMITVTALALLIYLFGGYADYERRQKNECTKS
jgi:hypothetical protein